MESGKLVVQSLDLGLLTVGQELFGGDGNRVGGVLVAVLQEADLGHDVVFEGKSGVVDVPVVKAAATMTRRGESAGCNREE